MWSIEVRNVNDAYPRLCKLIMDKGVLSDSRNGEVRAAPGATLVKFRQPWERVLFDAERDANPIFHLLEAVWMLAGRNDVEFVTRFNSNMASFSDDGETFNAAYGHRWRHHFGFDQLEAVVDMLRANPNDRRAIITMWDPADLLKDTKDVACNLQILPRIVDGTLEFTTTNRSNDLIWGLCGANAVHLSFLQEWMAGALGLKVGHWNHLSNNLHIYERHWDLARHAKSFPHWMGWPGTQPLISPTPIENAPPGQSPREILAWNAEVFRTECMSIADGSKGADDQFRSPFLNDTVEPMLASWAAWKAGDKADAIEVASCIEATDWRRAVVAWYKRRNK